MIFKMHWKTSVVAPSFSKPADFCSATSAEKESAENEKFPACQRTLSKSVC